MKIISVVNHKGGVGKTTLCGTLAQALALCGKRVLAIDNDSQHNLSTLLGLGVCSPNILDVYKAPAAKAARTFLTTIHHTPITNLHLVTSERALQEEHVEDTEIFKKIFQTCQLQRFYDYVLFDNSPGLDRMQISTIRVADQLLIPTELKQFAVEGLVEMEKIIRTRIPDAAPIGKIIANFYRGTKRDNGYLAALQKLFPGKVCETTIGIDQVFDEVVSEDKILFLHRLRSRGATMYLELLEEVFDLDEHSIWQAMVDKQKEQRAQRAREIFGHSAPDQ